MNTTTQTTTLDVSTNSLRDIRKALSAAGSQIIRQHTTPGAVGYTTITITKAAR